MNKGQRTIVALLTIACVLLGLNLVMSGERTATGTPADDVTDGAGACCAPAGNCLVFANQATCMSLGGIWHGDVSNDCSDVLECQGPCCLTDGTCTLTNNQADCDGTLGNWGGVGDVDGDGVLDITCADGTSARCGACCLPNYTCEVFRQVQCFEISGANFLGVHNVVNPSNCEDGAGNPVACGACCDEGDCFTLITEEECERPAPGIAGFYQGDFIGCGGIDCADAGACCLPTATCMVLVESSCDSAGGIWRGVDTVCGDFNQNGADDVCETIPLCGGDLSGNGQVDFADVLIVIAEWGPCP
ncbi:MAG: hypothetical protein GY715_16210 [Planctomycetes bacterium]|nr:hypothetical protein [Planctomycetota bacterium]